MKKRRIPSHHFKPIRIARYCMQDAPIEVWLVGPDGYTAVDFDWTPSAFAKMTIPMSDDWCEMVKRMLHEVVECSLRWSKGAYLPAFNSIIRSDTGSYRFMFDHDQFAEAMVHAGDMVRHLYPDLQKEWRKAKAKQKGGV